MRCWPSTPRASKFLIGKGADVNKLNDQGYAPLHTAARNRNSRLVELLLEHKADPNLPDSDGVTPLVHAINRNHVPSIELLARRGADIERRRQEGLHAARDRHRRRQAVCRARR